MDNMSSRKRNPVVEEFIDIYKSEYCLWRVKCKEYHDKNKRAVAYDKLLQKLKELEPNATKQDVINKINSLRSNVRKEKKKCDVSKRSRVSADEIYKPALWYYDLFDFLGDQSTPRESTSNMDEHDEDDSLIDSAEMSTENNNNECDDTENDFNFTNGPTNDSKLHEQQLPAKNTLTRGSRPPKNTNEEKLTKEVLASVNEHFKRPVPQEDRYELLGKTIAIKLRTVEKKQRLIAEKIINDTLFEAEMGQLNQDSYQGRNKYHTGQYISTPSPTYISSPSPSPHSSTGTENFSASLMQQAQTLQPQYYLHSQLRSGSSQNSYLVQVPETPPAQLSIPSIPDDTVSASSYLSTVNFE